MTTCRDPRTLVSAAPCEVLDRRVLRATLSRANRQRPGGRSGLFCLGDELGDFGVRAYGLDEENLLGVEVHPVGLVEFFAALDEDVVRLQLIKKSTRALQA